MPPLVKRGKGNGKSKKGKSKSKDKVVRSHEVVEAVDRIGVHTEQTPEQVECELGCVSVS